MWQREGVRAAVSHSAASSRSPSHKCSGHGLPRRSTEADSAAAVSAPGSRPSRQAVRCGGSARISRSASTCERGCIPGGPHDPLLCARTIMMPTSAVELLLLLLLIMMMMMMSWSGLVS